MAPLIYSRVKKGGKLGTYYVPPAQQKICNFTLFCGADVYACSLVPLEHTVTYTCSRNAYSGLHGLCNAKLP